ncbi:MAG: UDP-3-O-(3-hydroxymyristoyl)glucosamine N-acyltransferase [Campylobacterota bacterium]|nr:UDP-3-O-(3-hydroxymyristoyl)glucosamine N-acyltransferase [Campylobacterota bacterium]
MITLDQIAKSCGIAYSGDALAIKGINTLKEASSDEISFLDNKKYIADLNETKAAAVFISEAAAEHVPEGTVALVDSEPYLKMALASKLFAPLLVDEALPAPIIGEGSYIAPSAAIANGAVVGRNCQILPGVYVGARAVIGDNTILHANATVYHDCVLGNDCIIHSGTVVGSDGFGFAHTQLGEHVKIYQNGNVVLEDDVEVGSNSSIDRAVFGSTLIKKGAKLDNLIQIGHNCEIGEYCILVAQSGVAGSTTLGRNVVMGGQAATAGHLKIAAFSQFAARSGITNHVKEKGVYGGFPLMTQRQWLKLQAKLARLLKS